MHDLDTHSQSASKVDLGQALANNPALMSQISQLGGSLNLSGVTGDGQEASASQSASTGRNLFAGIKSGWGLGA